VSRHDNGPAPGNLSQGEALFWGRGNCGQCHRVGERGGFLGPELTRVGKQRSLGYLRESIVAPDADITPGYATIRVVTRDGKQISGLEKGFDNFTAQLMDPQGKFYSFDKSEVSSAKREKRSLMPDNYGTVFNATELTDLVAYLASLHGTEGRR
jgi:quinoprotein glucose dehydrogenase